MSNKRTVVTLFALMIAAGSASLAQAAGPGGGDGGSQRADDRESAGD